MNELFGCTTKNIFTTELSCVSCESVTTCSQLQQRKMSAKLYEDGLRDAIKKEKVKFFE